MQPQGNRASLLANLRTGGVRSSAPHSAGPTGSFQIPRFASQAYGNAIYEDDEDLLVAQMQQMNFNGAMGPRGMMNAPMTAGISNNQFQQQQLMMMQMLQQQGGMAMSGLSAEQQALQLQLQNEILILQAKQQQHQLQAQIQAQQAQLQAQLQAAQAAQQAQSGLSNTRLNPLITRRVSAANAAVPSSAGPLTTSFNLGNGPAPRRTMSIDQDSVSQPPMTAAIGGRFGARAPSLPVTAGLNPNAASFSLGPRVSSPVKESFEPLERGGTSPPNNTPLTANYASTTVISGGTSLGAPAANPTPNRAQADPSWRRSTPQSSSPESQRLASSSPPFRDHSPVSACARDNSRARPQPLRFNSAVTSAAEAVQSSPSSPEPDVVATGTDGVQTILVDNGHSTGSRSPASISPTTPVGGESLPSREEASKRLYEGLSVARSLPGQNQLSSAIGSSASLASMSGASTPARALSQAVRQPRGPPTEVSELGPRNFASRVRSKAIGGLEAMMMARNRRQGLDVEAF